MTASLDDAHPRTSRYAHGARRRLLNAGGDAASPPLRLAFVGPPGSGKGTQAQLLAERHGLRHISTGALLRDIGRDATAAGAAVREVMAAGDLMPDALVLDLVMDELRKCAAVGVGFVLDGFPRTVSQYAALARGVEGSPFDLVVNFHVGREHLNARLAQRGRADDIPGTVERRLDSFRRDTVPMIRFLTGRLALATVDGEGSVDAVRAALERVLREVETAKATAAEIAPSAGRRGGG